MKNIEKFLCTFLIVIICLTAAPLDGFVGVEWPDLPDINFGELFGSKANAVNELATTGQCGDNAYWNYDAKTGELVISGSGNMWDYTSKISPFAWNGYIKNITIKDEITNIGNSIFCGVFGLTNVNLEKNIKSIGDSAFASCTNLVRINFPEGLKTIGNRAFDNCHSLESVELPDSVTYIGDQAFSACWKLKNLKLSNKITCIGWNTFSSCKSLTKIIVSDNISTISDSAFSYCENLVSVEIGKGVTHIGQTVFYECDNLTKIIVDDNNNYYSSDDRGVLFNKAKTLLIKYPVGKKETSYNIPNTVTTIDFHAFTGCDNLQDIAIPDSVTYIDRYAFSYCNNISKFVVDENNICYSSDNYGVLFNKDKSTLIRYPSGNERKTYNIPETVIYIGESAFDYCDSITKIAMTDSVKYIRTGAFLGCNNLSDINLSNSLIAIESGAFEYCENITDITIGSSVKSIGSNAFFYCKNLKNIKINEGITSIGEHAFQYCVSLENVVIPDSVIEFGKNVFSNCDKLVNIAFGSGITSISANVFYGCISLEEIIVDAENKNYSNDEYGVLFDKEKTTLIKYPVGNKRALYEIPEGVTALGFESFYESSNLTDLSIPSSVSVIREHSICKELKYICWQGTQEEWNHISIGSKGNESLTDKNIHFKGDNSFLKYIDDKNATCQFAGTKTAYCNVCGTKDTIADETIGDHIYYEVERIDQTCTTNGKVVYKCKYCTKSYEEILKAGHIFYEAERVDSTCTQEGKIVYKCQNCTESYVIILPSHILYEAERIDQTCTANGKVVYKCKYCTKSYEEILKAGHIFYEAERVEQTCTQDGKVVYKCKNCDYSEEKVYKASHLLIIKEYLEASCTKEGKRRGTCTVCGMDVEEVIPATGHMWQNEYVLTTTPTCTTEGEEAIHCKTCWTVDEKTITVVPKLGHSWRETYEILDKPTCAKEGREAICCERCLAIKDGTERAIDKLPHTFVGWTLINGEEALYCTSCHCLLVDGVSDLMGRCGDNVYWQLNETTGKLVISGSGDMWDYNNGISPFRGLDIKSVVVENGVTSIGNWTFLQCSSIKSVTLSNTITRIGQRAFETCDSIKSIVIPNSVKRIEKNAFMFCSNLTGIKFGDGLESIEYMAFAACINLEELDIPDSVTYIGPNAFDRCYSLQSVVIGDGLKSIEYGTFYRCYELADVTLGKNIYFIGDEAFYICVNLTNINIPDSVKIIGNYAFNCCFRLSDVIIPDSVTTIGEGAFQCCHGITNITIGSGVEEIRSYTFTDMPFLDKVIIKNIDVNIGENALCINQIDPLNKSRDELLDLATVLPNADDPAIHEEWEKHCLKEAVYTGTIYCHKGSTAEKYAIENGINYQNIHFYDDWSYSSDNTNRWRKCIFCDEIETEQLENKDIIIETTVEDFKLYSSTNKSFTLSWQEKEIADGYQLAIYDSDSNTYSIISTTDKTTYTANNIEPYTYNKYVVRFYYEENDIRYCSKWSDEVVAGTSLNIGPANITAKINCDSIELEWDEIKGVCGYEVYQKIENGIYKSVIITSNSSVKLSGLDVGETYSFKVRAFIGSESNPWYGNMSDVATAFLGGHTFTGWVTEGNKSTRYCEVCNYTETKINTDGGDIEIEAPEQSDGTDFVVDEIVTGGKDYVVIEEAVSNGTDNSWEVIKAFNINLKNHDGVHVQPNGTVKVKLPNDWSKDGNYKVYRVNDDGTLTDMNAYRQGSHLVFDTDHFSIYVVVGETEKTDTPDETEAPENPSDNCSCKCHKTGFFTKLIWKITIFFNRLFKKNKVCSCGVNHY